MAPPLRRNREFLLLQTGQFLSELGTQTTTIAYPLLVLSLTRSAALAGLVAFARAVPFALFLLPAGLAADRLDRKRLLVAADAVRVAAIGGLAALIVLDRTPVWAIAIAAFTQGTGGALFWAAQGGAVRAVVPPAQLPAAAAALTGRQGAVQLAGPALGGVLFGLGRSLPFLVDALSYAFSTLSVIAVRTPLQEQRARDRAPLRRQLTEGVRFLWTQPFLRTTALLFGLGNFIGPGLVLSLVVIGKRQGLSAARLGALTASLGACLLVGSLVSPAARRYLSARAIILLELWTGLGCAAFLLIPNPYVLAAGMIPTTLAIPSTNSVVHGYRLAMTPDRLVGRVESARSTMSLAIAPLGPLLAGVMLGAASARVTVAVFAAASMALAMWGTLSPSIRNAPGPDTLRGGPER